MSTDQPQHTANQDDSIRDGVGEVPRPSARVDLVFGEGRLGRAMGEDAALERLVRDGLDHS